MQCPSNNCGQDFNAIQDALSPSTASAQCFFKFVNYTQTGRITKEELADWYTSNFYMTSEDAMNLINRNWQFWDVPKNRSFVKLGWFRSKDQGDLDIDEFPPVQEFMKESLARSLAAIPTSGSSDSKGVKRAHSEIERLKEDILDGVAKKKRIESEELQRKLRNNVEKGRTWFDQFDFDKSGKLEKRELTAALLQTFLGTHKVTREHIESIVDAIWDALDTDCSGSVDFDEFQMLREIVVAQLLHDQVANAVSQISKEVS